MIFSNVKTLSPGCAFIRVIRYFMYVPNTRRSHRGPNDILSKISTVDPVDPIRQNLWEICGSCRSHPDEPVLDTEDPIDIDPSGRNYLHHADPIDPARPILSERAVSYKSHLVYMYEISTSFVSHSDKRALDHTDPIPGRPQSVNGSNSCRSFRLHPVQCVCKIRLV